MQQTTAKVLEEIGELVKKNNYGHAIQVCNDYLNANKEDLKILLKLGDLYVRVEQYHLATKFYLQAAEILANDGCYTRAISVYDSILKYKEQYDKHNLMVLQKMLELYQRLGYKDEIFACKDQISDLLIIKENKPRTRSSDRFLKSAQNYEKRGLFVKAILEYNKYLKYNPSDVEIICKIAQLHAEELYNIDTAIDYYLQAGELAIRASVVLANHIYEKALKLDKNNLKVLNELLKLYEGLGYYDEINRLKRRIKKAKVFNSKIKNRSSQKIRLSREIDKLIKRAKKGDKRALNQLSRLNKKIASFLENQEPKNKKLPAKKIQH